MAMRFADRSRLPSHQRGAASLLAALFVLIILTGLTLVSAQIATVEQTVAGNEIRERQAFDAAMTGYEDAMAQLASTGFADADGDTYVDPIAPVNDLKCLIAPTTVDGTVQVKDCDTVTTTEMSRLKGRYAVEICDPVLWTAWAAGKTGWDAATTTCPYARTSLHADFQAGGSPGEMPYPFRPIIYVRGWSDDQTGLRHIIAATERLPALGGPPGNPLTTKSVAIIGGNGQIINPEGRSTIWSGDYVSFTSSTYNTQVLDPSNNVVIESTRKEPGISVDTDNPATDEFKPGFDIVEADNTLNSISDDDLFSNFFGLTPGDYKANQATLEIDGADIGDYDGVEGEIMWVNGDTDFSGNQTFGSENQPVTMIIDGNLTGSGNITVNGFLYVRGDWNLSGGGTIDVNGAAVVEGTTGFSGTVTITYDSALLTRGSQIGRPAAVPGAWRDWWKESD